MRRAAVWLELALLLAARAGASEACDPAQLDALRALLIGRKYAQAVEPLRHFTSQHPSCDPDEWRMLALTLLNLGKSQEALDAALQGLSLFPASPLLQEYFVSAVSVAASKESAVDRLRQALGTAPGSRPLERALCKALLRVNPESPEAGARLQKLAAADPGDLETRCYYAEWLLSVNRARETLKELDAVRKTVEVPPPLRIKIDLLAAVAHEQLGQTVDARAGYRSAAALSANAAKPDVSALWSYASFLLREGEQAEARTVLDGLLRQFPLYSPAHLARAQIFCDEGRYSEAVQQAQTALDSARTRDEQRRAHVLLSRAFHLAGNDEQARLHAAWVDGN